VDGGGATHILISHLRSSCIPGTQLPAATAVGVLAPAALARSLAGLTITVASHVHGGGLALLLVPLDVESAGLTIVQALVTLGVDAGEVHEHILGAVLGRDEAEALLPVKELDGTTLHPVWIAVSRREI